MENDKPNINEELGHIKNSINKKKDKISDDDDFIILDKIISKGKKNDFKTITNNEFKTKNDKKNNNNFSKKKIIKSEKKPTITNKNFNPVKKTKDPVAELVDREIKPIIKKWIGKNLKSFVKTMVLKEMKLISKATEKHK